jgi:hypothetical protein
MLWLNKHKANTPFSRAEHTFAPSLAHVSDWWNMSPHAGEGRLEVSFTPASECLHRLFSRGLEHTTVPGCQDESRRILLGLQGFYELGQHVYLSNIAVVFQCVGGSSFDNMLLVHLTATTHQKLRQIQYACSGVTVSTTRGTREQER